MPIVLRAAWCLALTARCASRRSQYPSTHVVRAAVDSVPCLRGLPVSSSIWGSIQPCGSSCGSPQCWAARVSNLLQGVCRLLPLWWLGSTAFRHTTSSSPTYLTLFPTVCGSAVLVLLFLSQLAGVAADVCAGLWVFPLFQLLS